MSDHPQFVDPLIPSFWKYDGEAFEWSVVGSTIAVREELHATVAFLDHYGCPPIDDILLFLGAFSRKADVLIHFAKHSFDEGTLEQFVSDDWASRLTERIDQLRNLAQDPPNFPQWKSFLASQTLCQAATPGRYREALALETLFPEEPPPPREQKTLAFRRFVAALRKLIAPDFLIKKERIENLWHTSVDRPPEPPELDVPSIAEDANPSLFDLIRKDSEPAALAIGVAEALWPAFSLKSKIQRPQDLPLGGFSDLTNKGSLDRLLPTELAFDDTILAARIVSGEALYSRREAPPLAERHRRIILSDSGIRMWGVRRIIAAGIAIALARAGTDDLDAEVLSNSTNEDHLPSDFSTADGIIRHLTLLSPEAHPAKLLEHALDSLPNGPLELFLLTTEATLEDPDFTRALSVAAKQHPIQIFNISPDGHLHLSLQSAYGRKNLRELTIDLDRIDRGAGKSRTENRDTSDPTFLKLSPLPLRILTKPDLRKSAVCSDDSIVSVSRQRDLLHWDSEKKGALSLSPNAPPGVLLAADLLDDVCSILSVHSTNLETVLFICKFGSIGRTVHLPPLPSNPKAAFVLSSVAVLMFETALIAFDENGKQLDIRRIEPPSLVHGHYLLIDGETLHLSFSTEIVLTPVPSEFPNTLFQWSSLGAICTAYVKGNETLIVVDNGSDQETTKTPGTCKIQGISPTGEGVVLKRTDGTLIARDVRSPRTFSHQSGNWVQKYAPHLSALDLLPATIKNFQSLIILTDRSLGLLTRRNAIFTISAENGLVMRHDETRQSKNRVTAANLISHKFTEEKASNDLQKVSFPNVVDIFLDSRGFLHFLPASSDQDEFTLSLNAGVMSGWTMRHGPFDGGDRSEAGISAYRTFEEILKQLAP